LPINPEISKSEFAGPPNVLPPDILNVVMLSTSASITPSEPLTPASPILVRFPFICPLNWAFPLESITKFSESIDPSLRLIRVPSAAKGVVLTVAAAKLLDWIDPVVILPPWITVLVLFAKSDIETIWVKLRNSWAVPKVKLLPLEVPVAAPLDTFSVAVNVAIQNFAPEPPVAVGGVTCQPVSRPVNAAVAKVKVASLFESGPCGAVAKGPL